jgi:hypothetical protein
MGISVKVSTKKLITAMEQKVATNMKKLAEWDKATERQKVEKEKHEKFVWNNATKIAKATGVTPSISVSEAGRWGHNAGKIQVELTYYLSPEDAKELIAPKFEDERFDFHPSDLRRENEELNNAIRLLNMTDEEYVNTNTYKHVAKYL